MSAAEPRWQDAFDATPELLIVVFPSALRTDRVYGPLLRRTIELARQQSRVVAETRALDAMEDADEVIVGLHPGRFDTDTDMIVVVRGVRADVDPAALVDAEGRPLWAPGPTGRVRELVRAGTGAAPDSSEAARDEVPASLFELPGRTWVIASGQARARARSAFAHAPARSRQAPMIEPRADQALVTVRIDGASLVRRIPALQPTRILGPVGHRLDDVSFELSAGSIDAVVPTGEADGGAPPSAERVIKATLSYANGDAAALAEVTVREVLEAIARKRPDEVAWLADGKAAVERPAPGRRVVVTAPLPPRLVAALLHAGTARLALPEGNPRP
jgi:hypothetical protein